MNTSAGDNSKSPRKKYTHRSEKQWRALIDNFKSSGLTLEAYCKLHKIASSGFYNWRKRFQQDARAGNPSPVFVDITPELTPQPTCAKTEGATWQVELELGSRCILRIRSA